MIQDHIKLKSGKEIYANRKLVSIRFTDEWELFEGYDGEINLKDLHPEFGTRIFSLEENEYVPKFTKEELIDLSHQMIDRWHNFIAAVINNQVPVKLS